MPFEFGFFPSTLGEDGEPLDALVQLDAPVAPGCIVTGWLIEAIEVEQREGYGAYGPSHPRHDG